MWEGLASCCAWLQRKSETLRVDFSVAVFEADACRDQRMEDDSLEDWQGIQLGYSQTKWVTDRMVRHAAQSDCLFRFTGPFDCRPSCGSASAPGDTSRLLQGCLALGASPDLAWELDVVPVDYVADAVSALAWVMRQRGVSSSQHLNRSCSTLC